MGKIFKVEHITGEDGNAIMHLHPEESEEGDIFIHAPDPESFRPAVDWPLTDRACELPENAGPGYHVLDIPRGEFGEASKIFEEVEEFRDAYAQGVKLMELLELSDLLGAIDGYLAKYHQNTTLIDLVAMKNITQRAFENGHRVAR